MIEARAPQHLQNPDTQQGALPDTSGLPVTGLRNALHATLSPELTQVDLIQRAESALGLQVADMLIARAGRVDPDGTKWTSTHALLDPEKVIRGTVIKAPNEHTTKEQIAEYTFSPAFLPADAAAQFNKLTAQIEATKKMAVERGAHTGRRDIPREKLAAMLEQQRQSLVAQGVRAHFDSSGNNPPEPDQTETAPLEATGLIATISTLNAVAQSGSELTRSRRNRTLATGAAALAAASFLSACGGAAQPGLTPKVEYAPTSTAAPTATRIEPTATIFASPTPPATLRPPEIRPSVTPDPNTLSKITFAQFEKMQGAAPLVGALRAFSDTRRIGANFDAAGKPTFDGVDLSIASQVDAQGKVKPEGSFPYFTVKNGPDSGVVQRGTFYAPAFDAEQNPDGSFAFKFYEKEDPVVLLPTTLQKLLGVSDAIRVVPDLRNGRFSVVRLSADGNPADVVAWTSLLNFDHLTPDQMVWVRPNNEAPPIKPSTGITPTVDVTGTAPITGSETLTRTELAPTILTEIQRSEGVSDTTYRLNTKESGGVRQISIANITFADGKTARPDFTPKALKGLSDMTLSALVINQSLSTTGNLPDSEDMPRLLEELKKDIAAGKAVDLNMVRVEPGTFVLKPYPTKLQPKDGGINIEIVDADGAKLPQDCDRITLGTNTDGTAMHTVVCAIGNTVYLGIDSSNVRPSYNANAGSPTSVTTPWTRGLGQAQMGLAMIGRVTEKRLGKGRSDGGSLYGTGGANPVDAGSDWAAFLRGTTPTEPISRLMPNFQTFANIVDGKQDINAKFNIR